MTSIRKRIVSAAGMLGLAAGMAACSSVSPTAPERVEIAAPKDTSQMIPAAPTTTLP
jgi:hypothetical protein